MFAMPSYSQLKRLPPGAWTALAWCTGVAVTYLMRIRLPGEWEPEVRPGILLYQWNGLIFLAVATVLTLAGGGLLRRRPLVALALMLTGSAAASTALSVGEIPLIQFLAVDVALYFIAATRPRRTGIVGAAMALGVLAGYLTTRLLFGWPIGTSAELVVALTAVLAWLIGTSVHQARDHHEELAAQVATQAVTAERLRIARELHDMVAHSVGIIAIQAGVGSRVIDTQPAEARNALSAIEATSRETLSGLRRMLGALRRAEADPASDPAPGEPAPGLADVDRLAASTKDAGVRVDVEWRGERRPLPPDIDLSVFRVIQEALTNVVRHAGTHHCRVSIDYGDEELSVEIVDDGHGDSTAGTGFGLAGMRERVGLLDGHLIAGPRPEGGFRVAARLPVPAGAR